VTFFADSTPTDLRRWLISGAIVLMAHGGLAAAILAHWESAYAEPGELGAAIVIDLEPLPVADAIPDVAPGPEQVQAEAEPEKPIEKTEEKVEEIPRAIEPDVALVEPEKYPEPPRPANTEPPAPATTAPQQQKGAVATVPPSWTRQVVGLLEKNKRYPAGARARNEQGVVRLAFSLDRTGHVTESHIAKSSGSQDLDNETLELLKRAQPFPPLPANVGDKLDLTVPIRFNIR
jgi:periplasmic protein TonB